jgi:hypothetical protein
MFKASETTTIDLRVIEGVSQGMINFLTGQLKELGVDIPLLFARGKWLPDWDLLETYPDAAQHIAEDIYRRGQEREYALEELARRRYPN